MFLKNVTFIPFCVESIKFHFKTVFGNTKLICACSIKPVRKYSWVRDTNIAIASLDCTLAFFPLILIQKSQR